MTLLITVIAAVCAEIYRDIQIQTPYQYYLSGINKYYVNVIGLSAVQFRCYLHL